MVITSVFACHFPFSGAISNLFYCSLVCRKLLNFVIDEHFPSVSSNDPDKYLVSHVKRVLYIIVPILCTFLFFVFVEKYSENVLYVLTYS